jgi:hypothetical protein
MVKLTRALTLAVMVATMQLAAMTVAQAHPTDQPDATVRRLLARERSSILNAAPAHPRLLLDEDRSTILNLPDQSPAQAAADAAHRRLLAQERAYSSWGSENPAIQQALAQERAYRTSGYGDASAPAPTEASGQAGRRTPALGVLAAVLALVAGVAVVATRRANRSQQAGQTA